MEPFHFPGQTQFYSGKVRDVYTIQDEILILVASDRISAFDVILPHPIPYKGHVLTQIAAYMLEQTRDICPNWFLRTAAPQVSIGRKCTPVKLEMVVRGNLTGHAWRHYASGGRMLCGAALPNGLHENDYFPQPILTPSTKADVGHDEEISPQEIIQRGIVSSREYEMIEHYSLQLFARGKQMAAQRGLILADTKYEFGKIGDTILLIDEIHTPDSSRYFYAGGFEERQNRSQKQEQLSKEFVREWLIANEFMGKSGQQPPPMSQTWINEISNRYIQLYEILIGKPFVKKDLSRQEIFERVVASLNVNP